MTTTPADLKALDTTAITRLTAIRQRYTSGRRLLLHTLAGAEAPVTIPTILRSTEGLAQSSVYRNLATLTQAGLVRQIPGPHGDHAFFTLTELAGGNELGAYLRCTACTTIAPVELPPRMMAALRTLTCDTLGTITIDHTCPDCTAAREHTGTVAA